MSALKPYAVNANDICGDPTPITLLTSGGGKITKNKKGRISFKDFMPPTTVRKLSVIKN